ncbi:hypothetical protein [uncultured Granulicatella sp.]|jgi:hypothetical protein|uniref:hypothetical protein n=1 Tax=uncultured Granulicatella sp. TaxID=316089 RepID=UPI0028EF69DE|nr:hypothetical protein [uncultured Granulicatella sp.]
MATNSFLTTKKFNKESINSLLHALENNRKVHLKDISNVRVVSDTKEIEELFKKNLIRNAR